MEEPTQATEALLPEGPAGPEEPILPEGPMTSEDETEPEQSDADRALEALAQAQALVRADQESKRDAFGVELQMLLAKYNFMLSARFSIFGVTIDPPIAVMPAPRQQPLGPPQG